jgi:hypothetical protein
MASKEDIAALLASFDDEPNLGHGDVTPAVLKLIEQQLDGAAAVMGLLNSNDGSTRSRAQRVLEGAIGRHFGFQYGQGYPDRQSEQKARVVIEANGYDAGAPEERRLAAIERWRKWVNKEKAEKR